MFYERKAATEDQISFEEAEATLRSDPIVSKLLDDAIEAGDQETLAQILFHEAWYSKSTGEPTKTVPRSKSQKAALALRWYSHDQGRRLGAV